MPELGNEESVERRTKNLEKAAAIVLRSYVSIKNFITCRLSNSHENSSVSDCDLSEKFESTHT